MSKSAYEYIKNLWCEIIYIPIVLYFLTKLNYLNKELLFKDLNPFDLLAYNNFQPLKYFFFSSVMVIYAFVIIINRAKKIKHFESEGLNLKEIIFYLLSIITMIIFIIFIIVFINNPILRAIFSCLLTTGILIAIFNN